MSAAVDRKLKADARASDRAATEAANAGADDAREGRPAEVPFGMDSTAYLAGYDTEKAKRTPKTKSTKKAPAKTSSTKKSTAKKRPAAKKAPARRRRSRSTSKASRAITAPAQRQMASGLTALGLTFGLAVLYNFLTHADAAAGVIAGAARAVKWLDSPTSIPYGGK